MRIGDHSSQTSSSFRNASITRASNTEESSSKLAPSRAYNLALAPQLIYTDSKLLPSLVSSKTYRQLEFVAMGSWFVYDHDEFSNTPATLLKIPTTREDLVFSDQSIDIRSKRAIMKVLRFLMDYETQEDVWQQYAQKPFTDFLSEQFKLPERLHSLFLALVLSLDGPQYTSTAYALPRIARHLRSIGQLGPGFSSVIPKWGGLSEITQVACRAGAVGGAVYVLNKGLRNAVKAESETEGEDKLEVKLSDDERVRVSWLTGTNEHTASILTLAPDEEVEITSRRSVCVISSPLPSLFPTLDEGGPPPAGAVIFFPSGSLFDESSPVYLIIHSSETGECPQGQSVAYGFTRGPFEILDMAMDQLLDLTDEGVRPSVLWCLKYETQQFSSKPQIKDMDIRDCTMVFTPPSLDLVFDENVLSSVKHAWQKIMGSEADEQHFLTFDDRNPIGEEDD
ncbi:hypothetical protein, variant [Verruconis gallopava]|nr:hypothetical protein, variant [Verruconis gallopava]KIW09470.1 hypothetical protein, variant [Verruconis gallopava]